MLHLHLKRANTTLKNSSKSHNYFLFREICSGSYVTNEGKLACKLDGSARTLSPIIRLFGLTPDSLSVCCNIHGLYPSVLLYLSPEYVAPPDALRNLQEELNKLIECKVRQDLCGSVYHTFLSYNRSVKSIELDAAQDDVNTNIDVKVRKVRIRIYFSLVRYSNIATVIIEDGLKLGDKTIFQKEKVQVEKVDHLNFARDMMKMKGYDIVTIPSEKVRFRKEGLELPMESSCDVEIDVDYEDISTVVDSLYTPSTSILGIPNLLRILAFDIEILPTNEFPGHGTSTIIQIGNILGSNYATGKPKSVIFVLGGCDPIDDVVIHSFDNEGELLDSWWDFVIKYDPDIITGYNILQFDLPYILLRSLGLAENARHLGRLKNFPVRVHGSGILDRSVKESDIPGRVILDVYKMVRAQHAGLPNYKLSTVAKHLINDTKRELNVRMIPFLQREGSATRKIIAEYCIHDVMLVYRILLARFSP